MKVITVKIDKQTDTIEVYDDYDLLYSGKPFLSAQEHYKNESVYRFEFVEEEDVNN